MRRRWLVICAILVAMALLGSTLQRRLIYFPADAPPPVSAVLPEAREVGMTTADGLELAAWHVAGGAPTVVVLPGNGGNRAGRAPLARALAAVGWSVLLVDYRGYGGNPGRPTEDGLHRDAEAAALWAQRHGDGQPVVYLGESLGAAVAVGLAVEQPPAALVLRSPFTSLADMARHHYGPVPTWLLVDRYPSLDRIADVDAPLLVIAGDRDEIVPVDHSRRLFEAAKPPKELVVVEGAGHNAPALLDGDEFVKAVVEFVRAHVPTGA